MKIAGVAIAISALGLALLAEPSPVAARGWHHALFGAAQHGHPINAWMGSRHLKLR